MLPQTSPAPEPLLARIAAGDKAVVDELIARYGGLIWSIARRFEPSEAEDAVQEILLDLWRSAARFDPALASEATFIAMIARRRLIDRQRSRNRRPESPVAEVPAVADESVRPELAADAATAVRALDQLRPEQRKVLLLATHGMSHGEIAAQTGMPLGTVKAHARRGLLAIRGALSDVPGEEDKP